MSAKLADYIAAGRALGIEERLEAARQLLLSVESDADVEDLDAPAQWDRVIERRVGEVLDGTAESVNGRQAHERIRAEIAASRV